MKCPVCEFLGMWDSDMVAEHKPSGTFWWCPDCRYKVHEWFATM